MTVDDVLGLRGAGDVAVSPDGAWVAYVVTEQDREENVRNTDVWVAPADGGAPVRLTRSPGSDGSPVWFPDGSWLAFRSDRADGTQVFGIRPDGGEAWQVTEAPTGVGSYAFAPDGHALAFTASPERTEEADSLEREWGRPIVRDSAYASEWTHLWVAPLEERRAGAAERVSPDGHQVQGFTWAPDGRGIAWSARPAPELRTYRLADVWVVRGMDGEPERVTSLPGGESPVGWTEELGLLISGSGRDLGTYNSRIWRVDPDAPGEPVPLTSGLDENAGFVGVHDGRLWVEAGHRTGRRLYRIPVAPDGPTGEPAAVTDDEAFYSGFSVSDDGSRLGFLAQGPGRAPDVHTSAAGSFRPVRLTELNPQVEDFALGESRVVRWSSEADGEEIEGVLTLPVGYREGERVPLLLRIHGGPSGVSTLSFMGDDYAYPTQVFAGLGYAVLQPNYRGSTGYGERFRGLNRGYISGTDWVDVESGVDHLVEEGIADPDRLGVMGWSFGGHHTYWGITRTDRFRAASAGAGANELVSMYHATDIPEFYHTYLGPKPWEDWELYEERSAYRYVEDVTTPLLIQVGERDERVPAQQSDMFYEAMKAIGKAPVTMVVYPGQPHGVRDPRLARDLMARNVAWFQRWIPTGVGTADRAR
jgi:dipeptidyl aminopeptidase/acylaminoacyl peptidase